MAFVPRIFLSASQISGGVALVTAETDINHVKNVLRIPVGGKVTLCDGAGLIYPATISEYSSSGMLLELGDGVPDDSELPFHVTVYQCYPKGEKAEIVVQKAVELGAHEIVFVMSERCIARPDDKAMEKKRARLQKIADGAAAQSGRCILPEVRGLLSYEDACKEASQADCAFLCYEGKETKPLRQVLEDAPHSKRYAFVIGPEGGIAPKELQIAVENGLVPTGLGGRILRTETAALFVLSAMNVLCD